MLTTGDTGRVPAGPRSAGGVRPTYRQIAGRRDGSAGPASCTPRARVMNGYPTIRGRGR